MNKDQVARLRHSLRTSLNHVLGFSAMLLEEAPSGPVAERLNRVAANARRILELMQAHLPQSGPGDAAIREFRAKIDPPLRDIIAETGALVQQADPGMLMDLLRVNTAATELLAFSEGALPESAPDTSVRAPRPLAGVSPPGRILLVDDDETNREMFIRQLERAGHSVESAESGPSALHRLQTRPFDLVLLDMLMPQMSGLSVLQEIRSNPSLADTPVIMLSAMDETDQVADCIQAGADDYLTKPSHTELLQARVAASLDRKRLRDRHREREAGLERMLEITAEANRDLEQFALAVSHDLQEPLRSMTVYAQLLQRRFGATLEPEANEFLEQIARSAFRMRAFVSDLLDFHRISSVQADPRERADLAVSANAAVANLQTRISETGANVRTADLPTVAGTLAEFTQVFQNLIGNALKYRQPDVRPEIEVRSISCPDGWRISVADNGFGIEPEYLERIFAPFQRLHGPGIPGTGIGLAVCRRVVERRGGKIWAESAGPGQGAVFVFTLPAPPQA